METQNERLERLKNKYPNFPVHCLPILKRGKKKSPSNQLADDIKKYCAEIKAHFQRINTQGNYNTHLKKWTFSNSTRGATDCLITYNGKAYHVEIKIGKDKLSTGQKEFKESVEQAGGIYIVAKEINQFKEEFKKYING